MKKIILAFLLFSFSPLLFAAELAVGDTAPLFKLKTHAGKDFDLASQKGKWTVLYFYPKAGTPGCTKQACAFRDSLDKIRALKAEVYGLSADTVTELAAFHKEHKLNFTLLADPDAKVVKQYGTKMVVLSKAKRWTFIINPELKLASIMKDVDPALDSVHVAEELTILQQVKK